MASYFPVVIGDMLFSFCSFMHKGRGEGSHAASGTSKTEYSCKFLFFYIGHDEKSSITTNMEVLLFFFLSFYLLILRERAQKGREKIPSGLCTVITEPDAGLNPMNLKIMT